MGMCSGGLGAISGGLGGGNAQTKTLQNPKQPIEK